MRALPLPRSRSRSLLSVVAASSAFFFLRLWPHIPVFSSHGGSSFFLTAAAENAETNSPGGPPHPDDKTRLLGSLSFASLHSPRPPEDVWHAGAGQLAGELGSVEHASSRTRSAGVENLAPDRWMRRGGVDDDEREETGRSFSSSFASPSTDQKDFSADGPTADSLSPGVFVAKRSRNKEVSSLPASFSSTASSAYASASSGLSVSISEDGQIPGLPIPRRGDIVDWRYLLFHRLHTFPSSPPSSTSLLRFHEEEEEEAHTSPGDVAAAAYISSVAEERRKRVSGGASTWRDVGVVGGGNADGSPRVVSSIVKKERRETGSPSFCAGTKGAGAAGALQGVQDCLVLQQQEDGKASGGDDCAFQGDGNRVLCIRREGNTTSIDTQLPDERQLRDVLVTPSGVHTPGAEAEQTAVSFSQGIASSSELSLALLSPVEREQQKRALLRILTRETQRGVSGRKFLTLEDENILGSFPGVTVAGGREGAAFSSDEDIQWLWVVALEGTAIFRFLGWRDEDPGGGEERAVATEGSGLQDGVCANPDVFLKAFPFWASDGGEQKQYELFSKLGKGSYGETPGTGGFCSADGREQGLLRAWVWAALALDSQAEHRYVVLKRMLHPKDERGKRIRLSGEREIFFGQMLAGSPQIARFLEAFTLPADADSSGVGKAEGGRQGAAAGKRSTGRHRERKESCGGRVCRHHQRGGEQSGRRGGRLQKSRRTNSKQKQRTKEEVEEEEEEEERRKEEEEDLWLVFVNEGYSLSHLFFSPDEQRAGLLTPSELWWLLKRGKESQKDSADQGESNGGGGDTSDAATRSTPMPSSASFSLPPKKRRKPSPFQAFHDIFAQGAAAPDFLILLRALMRQLLVALSHAHALHITHRDVKPENILLRPSLPLDVRLADWGSAILHAEHHNTTAVDSFLDLMAPGEPSADQETRGYQPPEAFAFSPPLSSFFHEEKNAHPRTQPDSSKEASRTERNEAAGVRARPPSSYHSAAGGQGSESSRTPQERGGGGGGASAESRGAKRQEKERRAGADRGHERDEDRQQESKTRREQTRRERTTDEFWRPPSYDVWGAGLTMLKIVLGDLEPLVVQDDRIRSKLERRFASEPAAVRDKALLYQALADLCLIPWIQDHSPSLSTPTHVTTSKSFTKRKIDRNPPEHLFPPLLSPSYVTTSYRSDDERKRGASPSPVEDETQGGGSGKERHGKTSADDALPDIATMEEKSGVSSAGGFFPLKSAGPHDPALCNSLHSSSWPGMFSSLFLKVAASLCLATEDYLPDSLFRTCKKVFSYNQLHACDRLSSENIPSAQGGGGGKLEESQTYDSDSEEGGGARADLRAFLALVQQHSAEDDEKQLRSALLLKRQDRSLAVSPSSRRREICRFPESSSTGREGPISKTYTSPSTAEKGGIVKRHSGGRAEESLAVSRDGASVDNSPCVRRSSSYEDGGNDPEGELPVETRHLSGLRKKQEELYLLPDLEETERRRCENETRQACADDDDWSQPGMEEAALDEAVVLRSQSHSLIVAENQAGREIVEARKVLGVVEHGAPRRHDDDIQQEKSEPGRRVGSEGGKRERTSLETEEDLGKAEQEKSRKRKNMKSKHQKHSPDACDDKLFAKLLKERDKANVGLPNALARDLLRKLLAFDPQERLTAEEAVRHPWFAVSPGVAGSQFHELFRPDSEKEDEEDHEEEGEDQADSGVDKGS